MPVITTPEPLQDTHDISAFNSGEASLDTWLKSRALDNMRLAASRTYVVCAGDAPRVVGFYALAMGQILGSEATGSMRRNMPQRIPCIVLGRLAIDQNWQGRGLGQALLQDAVTRSRRAASEVATRLMIVHAISPEAERFYEHHGFVRLPVETPTFGLDLNRTRSGA